MSPEKKHTPFIHFNRFAAIDFETANYRRESACAVAVMVVEQGKIIRQFYSLIKPPYDSFQFSFLHGITWEDVVHQPTFSELWPELEQLLSDTEFIAAHNASFDRDVLAACCEYHCITPINTHYLCTMRLSRILWDIRPTKLSDVCGQFGIPLDHHHAESDAFACAEIVLRAWGDGIPSEAFLKPNPVMLEY